MKLECVNCGSENVRTKRVREVFPYRLSRSSSVDINAEIPVRACEDCGFEFTDHEADDIRHLAVCKYLGIMGPPEVRSIRERYGLTRAQFAEITRLGEASLARWETGELVQNAANNDFLFLLKFQDNLDRLKAKNLQGGNAKSADENSIVDTLISQDLKNRFRSIAPDMISDAQREGNLFVL